ncbi:MAG: ArnT family glycosyltransferase [Weeksellaceae bacterium]
MAPPPWDQAAHTQGAIEYGYCIKSFVTLQPEIQTCVTALSNQYAPVVKLIGGVVMALFGFHLKLVAFTSTLWFIGAILAVYLLAKEISKQDLVAFLSAFFFAFFLSIYDNSRGLLLDIPLTAIITLLSWTLIKSEGFSKRDFTFYSFLLAGVAVVTKVQAPLYMPFLFAYTFRESMRGKKQIEWEGIVEGVIIAALISVPWLFIARESLWSYLFGATQAESTDPTSLFSAITWTHYLKLMINQGFTFIGFLTLCYACFGFIKEKVPFRLLLVGQALAIYIIFTIVGNKDIRFIYPLVPFVAIIFGIGMNALLKKREVLTAAILCFYVVFQLFSYLVLSFHFPFRLQYTASVTVPLISDISLLSFDSFPVKPPDAGNWQIVELVDDLLALSKNNPLSLLFIPNYEQYNDNILKMYFAKNQLKDAQLSRTETFTPYKTIDEAEEYVRRFTYIVSSRDEIALWYQLDKEASEQLRDASIMMLERGELRVAKEYQLPNGKTILLLVKQPATP